MASRLPPRSPSPASSASSVNDRVGSGSVPRANTIHLTPQTFQNHPYGRDIGLNDPRSSSTQSLRPGEAPGPNRRTLLIVYIHGFMGNETSFRSFPAHLHNLLTMTLSETHVVHSKIYPRYKSRSNISVARDAFSNWLSPHESDNTDVILVGHSLGGILGAEVILIPSHTPGSQDVYQHRILGLIAFDTPFLGMHPGVVSTGIASLFRGSPEQAESSNSPNTSTETASLQSYPETSSDPNFNPAFSNDVHLPVRNNKWERAWYFWNKHYGEVRKAAQSYVKSHLEFGGCLADYPGLKRRYDAVRSLEDIDDLSRRRDESGRYMHRVRFVNYYTASTGRIKEQQPLEPNASLTTNTEMQNLRPSSNGGLSPRPSGSPSLRLSLEEHRDNGIVDKTSQLRIDDHDINDDALTPVDPIPHVEEETSPIISVTTTRDSLPALPPDPIPPLDLDETKYTDQDTLEIAKKDHARQVKAFERAKKDHQKARRDREKLIEKRERQAKKEQEKNTKLAKKEEERLEKERTKRQSTLNPESQDHQMREDASIQSSSQHKPKRDRKFCSLPSKNQHGQRDQAWIRVYMEGMDEVVAHTSLFFVSETYAKLIGDTAERIQKWIEDDATTRILLSEMST